MLLRKIDLKLNYSCMKLVEKNYKLKKIKKLCSDTILIIFFFTFLLLYTNSNKHFINSVLSNFYNQPLQFKISYINPSYKQKSD